MMKEHSTARTNIALIELMATPHPSLPLKGGGEESDATSLLLSTANRTAVDQVRR